MVTLTSYRDPRARAGARDQRGRARAARPGTGRGRLSGRRGARREGRPGADPRQPRGGAGAGAPGSPAAAAPPPSPSWRCGWSRRRRARGWCWRSTTTPTRAWTPITTALGGPTGKLRRAGDDDAAAPRRRPWSPTSSSAAPCSRGRRSRAGLAAAVAADLVRDGPCRPFDLQLAARAIVDLRLASLRRYRRSGGPAVLPALWLADVCRQAGGALARRALLAAGERGRRQRSRSGRADPARTQPRRRDARRAAVARAARRAHARPQGGVRAGAPRAARNRSRTSRSPIARARHQRPPRAHPADRDRRAPARAGAGRRFTATCAGR